MMIPDLDDGSVINEWDENNEGSKKSDEKPYRMLPCDAVPYQEPPKLGHDQQWGGNEFGHKANEQDNQDNNEDKLDENMER